MHNILIPDFQSIDLDNFNRISGKQFFATKLSKKLSDAAKLLVEALIEGQLTEQQLIAAENSTTANRAILERLKTDGLDGNGEPLFPDIDQLEQLLEEAVDD